MYIRLGNENETVSVEINRSIHDSGWGEAPQGYQSTQTNAFFIQRAMGLWYDLLSRYIDSDKPVAFTISAEGVYYSVDRKRIPPEQIEFWKAYGVNPTVKAITEENNGIHAVHTIATVREEIETTIDGGS